MVSDAISNVPIGDRAKRLFMFYENRSDGFRPALAFVEKETGIPANKVSEIRKEIVEYK